MTYDRGDFFPVQFNFTLTLKEQIMSVMAALTVADGAATPVNHTFNPETDSPPTWVDSDVAKVYKHLQYTLSISRKKAQSANGVNRVKVSLTLPVGGDGVTIPASEVARFGSVTAEFLLPAKGSKQERKDLRVLFANALANAQVIDVIDELNSAW